MIIICFIWWRLIPLFISECAPLLPLKDLVGIHWSFPLFVSFVWSPLVFSSKGFVWNPLASSSVWMFCFESVGLFLCFKVLFGVCWPFPLFECVLFGIHWSFPLFESFVWNLLAFSSVWKFCLEFTGLFSSESFVWNLLAFSSVWKFCLEFTGLFLCLDVLFGSAGLSLCLNVLFGIHWSFPLFESFVWNSLSFSSVWMFCLESADLFLCLKVLFGIHWYFPLFECFV